MAALLPAVMREPGFRLYWLGQVISNIGTRGTVAANLWQMLQLTNSTFDVGLVGLAEALALLLLGPLGGAVADHLDRRRLLQVTQATSLLASSGLLLATLSGALQPWHIYLAVIAISASQSFEGPARLALIPALVRPHRVVDALALVNPTRELAVLLGPALAGVLIAAVGPAAVYAFDAASYAVLIICLAFIHIHAPRLAPPVHRSIRASIVEGFSYVGERRLILQLMGLDFSAMFFAAYRALLPTLARDVLGVGAAGYGLLAGLPSAGAIVGSGVVYRLRAYPRKGLLVLGATMAYALAALLLARAPDFAVALGAAAGLGFFDAISTTLRQALVQLDTPDRLRGRVTAAYQMVSRGGPSLGQAQMGALAQALGAPTALALGACVTLAVAISLALRDTALKRYTDRPAASSEAAGAAEPAR